MFSAHDRYKASAQGTKLMPIAVKVATGTPYIDVISVVIVDDVLEVRNSLARILALDPQFEIVADAANGKQGVAVAKKYQPAIVLMDIRMPIMDGFEACRQITQALPATGVVMMSVDDKPDDLRHAMLVGARYFIAKPIDPLELKVHLENVYAQYEPLRRRRDLFS